MSARFDARTSSHVGEGVTLVPVGATEQHGPHLPLGTDWWLAEAVALETAHRVPGVDVSGVLPYGISPHHRGFPGTVTLRPRTFIDLLVDVCGSLAANGRVPVILNGHGGNRGALQVAVADLGERGHTAWAVSYFELLADTVAELFPDGHSHVGHACALETSLVMHLWPDFVATDRIPSGTTPLRWPDPHLYSTDRVTVYRRFEDVNATGVVGTPSLATPEAGWHLFDTAAMRLANVISRVSSGGGL